jgi:hypothetical protein
MCVGQHLLFLKKYNSLRELFRETERIWRFSQEEIFFIENINCRDNKSRKFPKMNNFRVNHRSVPRRSSGYPEKVWRPQTNLDCLL